MVAVFVPVLAVACAGTDAPTNPVQRTDSAGIEIDLVQGADAPLDWRFERLFALGGKDDGPESFFRVGRGMVSSDGAGRIYVLDHASHRVVVFDSSGEAVGALGKEGGGPGEVKMPSALSVLPDGTVAVWDFAKRGLVRWGSDGTVLDEQHPEIRFFGPLIEATEDGLYYDQVLMTDRKLMRWRDGDTTAVAAMEQPAMQRVTFACVGIPMAPIFSPQMVWSVRGEDAVTVSTSVYSVDVYRAGRRTRVLRRDLASRPVTRAMAEAQYPNGMTVGVATGPCRIPASEVVEKAGYAETLPAIGAVALDPSGRIWLQRGRVPGEEVPIDVFTLEGDYLGTLPAGSPFPIVFNGDDRIGSVETDDLDVSRLTIQRVHTSATR
jgi:hypothetical protein